MQSDVQKPASAGDRNRGTGFMRLPLKPAVKEIASSTEFCGEFWLGKVAKCVI